MLYQAMKKKILIIAVIVAVAGALFVFYQFNKPHKNIAAAKPVATLSADELFLQFETNETESNQLYLGKIVEVTGSVYSNEKGPKGNVNVLLMNDGDMFGVACNFDGGKIRENEFEKGDIITIKGECAGVLSDVVLIRCVIVKTK